MKKNSSVCSIALALAAFSVPASAQTAAKQWYAGASLGKATHVDSCTLGPPPCDNKDTAYRLFGGYQLIRHVAAELGAAAFGRATVGGVGIKSKAIDLGAVVTLPVAGSLSVLGKLGAYRGVTDSTGASETKYGALFGGGLQYDSSDGFAVRAEVQRYAGMAGGSFANKIDLDVVTLGLLVRF